MLIAQVDHLDVGDTAEVALVGPGAAGDYTIGVTSIRVERLPNPDASSGVPGQRRYSFDARRANAAFTGALTAGEDGLPVAVEIDGRGTELSQGAFVASQGASVASQGASVANDRPAAPALEIRRIE
jgi:hypothetical protein